jgi:hypothetical protein
MKHSATCAVWLASATIIACGEFVLPVPPDMSRLVERYQSPNGELRFDTVEQIAAQVTESIGLALDGAPIELTSSLVDKLQEIGGGSPGVLGAASDASTSDASSDTGAGEQTVSGNRFDIGAKLRLRHICRGWGARNRIDKDENGTAVLDGALDHRGMLPTVWGHLDRCRMKRSDADLELTGGIRVHFGTTAKRVGLRHLKQIGYFVEFEGLINAVRGDEAVATTRLITFRSLRDGTIHVNVNLPDGTNVVVALDATTTLQPIADSMLDARLLTRSATWACKLNLDDAKGSCIDDTSAESVVTW